MREGWREEAVKGQVYLVSEARARTARVCVGDDDGGAGAAAHG